MCCGQGRTTHHPIRSSGRHADPAAVPVAPRRRRGAPATKFEYVGPTRLTVRGPLTGRTYVFDGRGAILSVDPHDAAALARIPGLRPAAG